MKIDSEQLLSTVNKFKSEPVEKSEIALVAREKGSRQLTDRVELSSNNSEVEQLKKAMQEVPDIRSDRVAALKEKIAAGTYKVDAKEVAGKMLQSWRELHDK